MRASAAAATAYAAAVIQTMSSSGKAGRLYNMTRKYSVALQFCGTMHRVVVSILLLICVVISSDVAVPVDVLIELARFAKLQQVQLYQIDYR